MTVPTYRAIGQSANRATREAGRHAATVHPGVVGKVRAHDERQARAYESLHRSMGRGGRILLGGGGALVGGYLGGLPGAAISGLLGVAAGHLTGHLGATAAGSARKALRDSAFRAQHGISRDDHHALRVHAATHGGGLKGKQHRRPDGKFG